MVAAVEAARQGARVTVLERMQRVGRKLLATGNGRCNLSNRRIETARYHGACPEFVEGIFKQFDLDATLRFFDALGVPVEEEEDGKLYPMSRQASSVLDVLRHEMHRLGVEEVCDAIVHAIEPYKGGVRCVTGDGRIFEGRAAIVCAGGKSSPNLGSNGGGYRIAQALGHSVKEPFPALVQVRLDAPYLNRIAGVGLEGKVEAWVGGKLDRTDTGELLFAQYGISGTAILQLSRAISEAALHHREVCLHIDLFPRRTHGDLIETIRGRIDAARDKTIEFSFVGFLHKRLIPVLLREAGIERLQDPCGTLTHEEITRISSALKCWTLNCTGTQSWMHSQVTAGGVDTREIDPRTLESKRAPGVYFAGEVLDVDGDSGGFNLQWAWSSGAIAGRCAGALP